MTAPEVLRLVFTQHRGNMTALDVLRLVFVHHKDIEGTEKCSPGCYGCEIEEYAKSTPFYRRTDVPSKILQKFYKWLRTVEGVTWRVPI